MFDSAWGLTFSPHGARLAYMVQEKTNWWMVIDGKLEAEIEVDVSGPYLSSDGKRLAYIAGRGPKWWMGKGSAHSVVLQTRMNASHQNQSLSGIQSVMPWAALRLLVCSKSFSTAGLREE